MYFEQLNINVKNTTKTKENVAFEIESMEGSKVFLLAFDQRLTYIRTGNEITFEEVATSLSAYDGDNIIYTDKMNNWTQCSLEELMQIKIGRQNTAVQSGVESSDIDDEESENLDESDEAFSNLEQEITQIEELQRENLNEVFIFDNLLVEDEERIIKKYKVPDSITTWEISAFAMNEKYGMAIAKPKQLTVKNEFFMVMKLPYSVRYEEILKVDVLVFNYVELKKNLNVSVKFINRNNKHFEFVSFKNGRPEFNKNNYELQTVNVPASNIKKVVFYIRVVAPENEKIISKNIQLNVKAMGKINGHTSGRIYKDSLESKLLVQPFGFKKYKDFTFNLYKSNDANLLRSFGVDGSVKLSNIRTSIISDYLTLSLEDSINHKYV